MLDDLDELRSFHRVLALGSLTAAALELGTSVAVVSKRLSSLERRTGTRLVTRTTRRLSPTDEGRDLFPRIERILEEIAAGEARLMGGKEEPQGLLRVSAPVSLGRRHVAPVAGEIVQRHVQLAVDLQLTDAVVEMVDSSIDIAIRIGAPRDSSAIMRKLADNRRVLVASPGFLDAHGRPATPAHASDLLALRYGPSNAPWRLVDMDGNTAEISTRTRLRTDNGDALHDWALAGLGVMLKSELDVASDLRCGRLERVLPGWTSASAPIFALFPSARHLPLKTRVFVEAMVARLTQA